MSYAPDLVDLTRRAAACIDRILKGGKPVELPASVELVVDMRTAGALGIKIPQPVLARADQVIE